MPILLCSVMGIASISIGQDNANLDVIQKFFLTILLSCKRNKNRYTDAWKIIQVFKISFEIKATDSNNCKFVTSHISMYWKSLACTESSQQVQIPKHAW
jgi:hypothetical protein